MKILELDSSGENVKRLQKRLKEFGFYKGRITGKFTPATLKAVREFQDSAGLASDGIAGLMTLHELDLLNTNPTQ